ncbi:TonB-dependent receptor [Marinomonas mediterranea]|uniref:TonB-dependent receptor n=1 Tax=Marinomonas mediterranea TaxID=119864 RepID=UPI00234949F8|nr:TonB-dependent receptor [Marinomonas mediterranea]WCN11600.1 TonB-dependent receptor [Marinomonas mediterranea]
MKRSINSVPGKCCFGFSLVISVNVMAEEIKNAESLPPLLVTSNKTEQQQVETTQHVTTDYSEDLLRTGVDSLESLEGVAPGLSFQPFGQSGVNSPVMRGVTSNLNALSSSTLLQVDGVPVLMAQGFESTLVGTDRVEVTRGPQTAIYGHNAETGVISIQSNDLNGQDETLLSLGLGSRDKQVVQFATSQTASPDKLFFSLSGEYMKQDGFIDNETSGGKADDRERSNLNAGIRWKASDRTDLKVRYRTLDYDDGASLWGSGTAVDTSVSSGTASWNKSSGQLFSVNLDHDTLSGIHLASITALNDYDDKVQQDTDFMASEVSYIARDNHFKTLSQEFRADGERTGLHWLTGAYLETQDHSLRAISKSYYGLSDLKTDQTGSHYALYGNLDIEYADNWVFGVGARASRDEVKITPEGSYERKQDWTNVTPQLSVKKQYTKNHQAYFSYSEGVRTGGFNTTAASANYKEYDPETVQSFEVGMKGETRHKSLRYSVAAYHMNIDDMQVMQMPSVGTIYLTNAAQATSQGVEASFDYLLTENLILKTGVAWNKTRFDEFVDGTQDYKDNTNPFAPEWNGHVTLRYDSENEWFVSASSVFNSKVYLNPANTYEQKGYSVINLSAGYPVFEDAFLSGYVNNLEDKSYNAVGYQNGYVTVFSPPREVGLKLTWTL